MLHGYIYRRLLKIHLNNFFMKGKSKKFAKFKEFKEMVEGEIDKKI